MAQRMRMRGGAGARPSTAAQQLELFTVGSRSDVFAYAADGVAQLAPARHQDSLACPARAPVAPKPTGAAEGRRAEGAL